MLKKILLVALLALNFGFAANAEETAIIASVGDDAITTQDLIARTRLIMISTGMKLDQETAYKIAPQVLQSLINERLQLQDAQKQNIEITNDEIETAVKSIETQNKMPDGQLKVILEQAKIPYSTLQQQVKGQIAWAKIRNRKVQPKIIISEDEITDYVTAQSLNPTQQEYLVNEIVLPVETSSDEPKIKELANKLYSELQSGKATFKNIAKQFSQSGSAQNGGEVGWLAENQIPKELMAEINKSGTGKIIGPVRSIEGYYILFVPESRTVETNMGEQIVTLRQFEIPFKAAKSPIVAESIIKSLNDPAQACTNAAEYAKSKSVALQDYGSVQIKQLEPNVARVIGNLPIGQFSQPLNTGKSFLSFVVCEKTSDVNGNVDTANAAKRDKAKEALFKRKFELESRKYLRDLRRNTNIEVK